MRHFLVNVISKYTCNNYCRICCNLHRPNEHQILLRKNKRFARPHQSILPFWSTPTDPERGRNESLSWLRATLALERAKLKARRKALRLSPRLLCQRIWLPWTKTSRAEGRRLLHIQLISIWVYRCHQFLSFLVLEVRRGFKEKK